MSRVSFSSSGIKKEKNQQFVGVKAVNVVYLVFPLCRERTAAHYPVEKVTEEETARRGPGDLTLWEK